MRRHTDMVQALQQHGYQQPLWHGTSTSLRGWRRGDCANACLKSAVAPSNSPCNNSSSNRVMNSGVTQSPPQQSGTSPASIGIVGFQCLSSINTPRRRSFAGHGGSASTWPNRGEHHLPGVTANRVAGLHVVEDLTRLN